MKRDYEIGDLIEESREYPLLIRGACAEEAVWLLGLEPVTQETSLL